MQVVHTERSQVVDTFTHAGKRAAESIDVGRITHHVLPQKPVRLQRTLLVQRNQRSGSGCREPTKVLIHRSHPFAESGGAAVYRGKPLGQRRPDPIELSLGSGPTRDAKHRDESLTQRGQLERLLVLRFTHRL
jgi:hypothetical protein